MKAYPVFMHPRNRHQDRYDLGKLSTITPELKPFLIQNKTGDATIDFTDQKAVRTLNKAILKSDYGIEWWDIPEKFLCPPIPGRADYIHSVADLFKVNKGLRVLDIGTGANCIYPLLGVKEYHWTFAASDIDSGSLENASHIVQKNHLEDKIELRKQPDSSAIFKNIILSQEKFDLTICNPPFHESLEKAQEGTSRKWRNLGKSPHQKLNFGGQSNELWCTGGEREFIKKMIVESLNFKAQVSWFTSLVSKSDNLEFLERLLEKQKALITIMEMSQGQKKSRVLCWTYKPDVFNQRHP